MCCHCIAKSKDEAASPTETMDTIAKLEKIQKMIVPASCIHEIIKKQECDLESLAKRELQKRLKRQAREQPKRKISSEEKDLQSKTSKYRRISDSTEDSESCTRATGSQEDMEQGQPEEQPRLPRPAVSRLENALQLYQQVQQDVNEPVQLHVKLRDPEGIVCAIPKHEVSRKGTCNTKGLLMIRFPNVPQNQNLNEAVKAKKVQFLEESSGEPRYRLIHHDNLYHQVQAWMYAGNADGYTFCDFVTYLEVSKDISVDRIPPDGEWQKKYIPKVRKYCKIFDELVKRKLEECQKS